MTFPEDPDQPCNKHGRPLAFTDGSSVLFKPLRGPKAYIRQKDACLIMIEPTSTGGWYSKLWKLGSTK
jgi:hypothetical protein